MTVILRPYYGVGIYVYATLKATVDHILKVDQTYLLPVLGPEISRSLTESGTKLEKVKTKRER